MSTVYKRLLKDSSALSAGMLYGIINSVMIIPVTISFCSIIYRDKEFEEYLPRLVKLVLFSSMIHQIAFTQFSSLPFAIGQVQDAGLIFLSSMAADIVQGCARTEQIVPTALVVLPLCTFILGCMLVVVAKLKLATVIQYLPMPVIGGYLAFIGFFCGQAGLAMMAGVQVVSIMDWGNFYSERALILLTPGVILGITTYLLLCRIRSPYVLPCCMVGILSLFFGALFLCGMTIEDAREYGWIAPLSQSEPFYHSWALYDFSLVDWSQFPQQILRLIGMFLVVAFSSSLDVAAIEMEMGLPLDYNRELNTVGLANVFSGLAGGYTGSYIFSQTIFTMRRGVYSRVNGYTVALCEALMIMIPISIISYLPKMFFGALLVLISTDLMMEWLVAARHKMAPIEFGVCLLTFAAIQATGIEVGMFIGILLAMASFVVSYSTAQVVSSAALQSSTVVRTFEERATLIANRGKVVTVTLKGYIFFGSAVKILEDIKSHVTICVPEMSPQQLMRLQMEQQQKQALTTVVVTPTKRPASATDGAAVVSTDADVEQPTEATSLLGGKAADTSPRYDGTGRNAGDFLRSESRKMSFRVGNKGRSPDKLIGDGTAKKLFPEGGAAQASSISSGDTGLSPPQGTQSNGRYAHVNSPPALTRTGSTAGTYSGSHSASLSVYDMSPETLKRAIEDRHQERAAESYGAFASAREIAHGLDSGGAPHGGSGVSQSLPKHGHHGHHSVAMHMSSQRAQHQHHQPQGVSSYQRGQDWGNPASTEAAAPASGIAAVARPSDIESGSSERDSDSPGRSLLTEKLEGGSSPHSRPLPPPLSVPVPAVSADAYSSGGYQQGGAAGAIGAKSGSRQPLPYRRQTSQSKAPAPSTATAAASFENAGLIDSLQAYRASPAMFLGATVRKTTSTDSGITASTSAPAVEPTPRTTSAASAAPIQTAAQTDESLLSLVFEHQQRRRTGGEAARLLLSPPDKRAALREPPGAYQVANALASMQGETIEGILRSRENSVDLTHEDVNLPGMKRERNVRDVLTAQQHNQAQNGRTKGIEKLHVPTVPAPEVVLGQLSSVQKLTQEMSRAAQQATGPETSEDGEVLTEYLVLDFASVVGVDATATRSCFLMMVQLMHSANVTVVFTNMSASLEALFRVHKVIGAQDVVIPLLDDALEWCEEQVLISAGHYRPNDVTTPTGNRGSRSRANSDALERNHSFYSRASQKRQQLATSRSRTNLNDLSASSDGSPGRPFGYANGNGNGSHAVATADPLRRILEDYLEIDSSLNPRLQQLLHGSVLVRYFRRLTFPGLEIVYDTDQTADKIYFIESGEVEIVLVTPSELAGACHPSEHVTTHAAALTRPNSASTDCAVSVVRVNKVHAGGAFGEADFLLGKQHSAQAHTMADCVLWTLDREQYARMEVEAPQLCLLIQHSVLKSLAIASTCALYAQHPTAACLGAV